MNYNELDTDQQEAVRRCCLFNKDNKVVVVSGRAGTGKTSIMRLVHEEATRVGHNVTLCAPTGKAARRISEATGIPAVTIHRLLEFPRPGEVDEKTGKVLIQTSPKKNVNNPLYQNIVLVDEAAMLANKLFRQLVDAIPRGGSGYIRLFGDANQLPPIENGLIDPLLPSPFIRSYRKNGIELKTIHRQGEGSGIVLSGSMIIEGKIPNTLEDFEMLPTGLPLNTLKGIINKDLKKFDCLENQIIIPGKKGSLGTPAVNTILQAMFRGSDKGKGVSLLRHPYDKNPLTVYVNDKVIMNKNSYELGSEGIMNGEVGIVTGLEEDNTIIVRFGDEQVYVPRILKTREGNKYIEASAHPQKDIDLAYAITTHKAQGSEYDEVIYLMSKSHFTLYRNNFYTGVTRARKKVTVIYEPACVGRALCAVELKTIKKL